MTPVLLLPAALAALAALVLPIVIHIARRSEQRPIDFAALRWLSERPRPRARLRLDERLLLAVRLLLLALLALLLARPALLGLSTDKAYVAIVPGADPARAGLDPAALRSAHWLAPGFPRQRDGSPTTSQPPANFPIGSLLRELDAARPAGEALTIVAPSTLQGADGERPRLSRPVRWIVTPGAMAERPAPARLPLSVAVRHDPAHAEAARYLRAALTALKPAGEGADVAGIAAPLPTVPAPVVWLAEGELPSAVTNLVRQGGTALVAADTKLTDGAGPAISLWADGAGGVLVEAQGLGAGRLLRFTRPLRPADLPALLEPDFPAQLQRLLQPAPPPPARADAGAYAPLVTKARRYAPPEADLRPWLALAIAALFLAERWLATRRARGLAP